MQALSVDYLFTPKGFVPHQTIIFDKTIIDVGDTATILEHYPDATIVPTPPHSCLIPGLINLHVHLEFSSNTTDLKYGRFLPWLYSVMHEREQLVQNCPAQCIEDAVASMVASGTTTFGAISSYGQELDACVKTPAKVIYFNELIGSAAAMADILWEDFTQRVHQSLQHASETFFPAVAIHSPYATHPVLVKKALTMARDKHMPTSAHFLESPAERAWLTDNSGEFADFFKTLLKQETAVTTPQEFLDHFKDHPTFFTHATQLGAEAYRALKEGQHTVVHCPVSNRLLGNGSLNIEALYEHDIPYVCGTDGLSSNTSLNLLDELKAALFIHRDANLQALALSLLHSVTTQAGTSLGMAIGKIIPHNAADMVLFSASQPIKHEEDLALHLILGNLNLERVWINGAQQ